MKIIRTWNVPWEYDPKHHIPHAEVFFDLRHGEYPFPTDQLDAEIYHHIEDDVDRDWAERKGFKDAADLPEDLIDTIDEDLRNWGTPIIVKGPLGLHASAFQLFAGKLMPSLDPSGYTPGGDDDYFDYWPGAMEALREYAVMLDELHEGQSFYEKPGFLGVYHNVLVDFLTREVDRREDWQWEHIPQYIEELAEAWGSSYDKVVDYIESRTENGR